MSNKTILALGSDVKNRFFISDGKNLSFGPEIGDLSNAKNYEFFKKSINKYLAIKKPNIIACDSHPGYFSSRFAKTLYQRPATNDLRPIQHHHAHIASVMHEHGLKGPVIGVAFDGTGYGADGNLWGGEFLLVGKSGFKRLAHLEYQQMPGGEKAILEPWRMALSVLGEKALPFIKTAGYKDKKTVLTMLKKNINTPLTSSAGRLFDACCALIGVCEKAGYESEGPIKLQNLCDKKIKDIYPFALAKKDDLHIIKVKPIFLSIANDLKKKKNKNFIATKFHNTVCEIIVKTAKVFSKNTGIKDIALSGGVFQNTFIRNKVIEKLKESGFNVFTNVRTPVNDLNISLGQYYVSCGTRKS